jgi:hypothetical protein
LLDAQEMVDLQLCAVRAFLRLVVSEFSPFGAVTH